MSKTSASSFFDLSAVDTKHQPAPFSSYAGKVVLVVNVASKCGFTGQYKGLEALYKEYKDKGLIILGFPCNQFGGQEPASDEEILEFCSNTYNVSFPIMEKIDVNGKNESPVYTWLKSQKNGEGFITNNIKWNFSKFLIGRNGQVVKRYSPNDDPLSAKKEVEAELAKSA